MPAYATAGAFTHDEVNYLVYRYLLESGFTHSSFAFQQESAIRKADIKGGHVKPGALISLLQKGLQYLEVETHINEDGTERRCRAAFSLITPHECISPVPLPTHNNNNNISSSSRNNNTVVDGTDGDGNGEAGAAGKDSSDRLHKRPRKDNNNNNNMAIDSSASQNNHHHTTSLSAATSQFASSHNPISAATSSNSTTTTTTTTSRKQKQKTEKKRKDSTSNAANDTATSTTASSLVKQEKTAVDAQSFSPDQYRILKGHNNEVFVVSWNPVYPLLATGSGDGTARVWHVPETAIQEYSTDPIVLDHIPSSSDKNNNISENRDVTVIDWHPSGEYLATGSYDGISRIWLRTGELKYAMRKHSGPVFSLKWNKKGDLLLSGSVDRTAIIWDTETGEPRQQFDCHSSPTLDVDWKDDITFASCSSDTHIYVCQLGSPEPLKQYSGHKHEVNAIKWDPTGNYLASCSDDTTARIWSLESDSAMFILQGHSKEIYTLRWCPVSEQGSDKLLATASFDATVRIWDVMKSTCLRVFEKHIESVYSVSWSPNGLYLASGSFDSCVNLWSLKGDELQRKYQGQSGVFEVTWNVKGNRVAACFADNSVIIFYI